MTDWSEEAQGFQWGRGEGLFCDGKRLCEGFDERDVDAPSLDASLTW